MHNLAQLDEYYKKYINNLHYWIPEGIYEMNLELLQHFNLLHFKYPQKEDPALTKYFHIVESSEKITLYNDEFVVWITPDRKNDIPSTFVLIAVNRDGEPKLELSFTASGVYNTSTIVLKVLEKFLLEIQENEKTLLKLKNK